MAPAGCLPRRLRPKWLRSSPGASISKGRTALFQQGARAAYGLHYSKPFLYRYLTAPAVIPLQGKFARSRRCARRFWPVELAKPIRYLYPWSHAAGRSRATGAGMRIYRDLVLREAAHCRFLGQYSGKAVLASVRRATRLPAPRALPGKPRRHYPGRRDAPGIFHKTEDDASRRPKAAGPACPRHDSSAFRRGDGGKQPSFFPTASRISS